MCGAEWALRSAGSSDDGAYVYMVDGPSGAGELLQRLEVRGARANPVRMHGPNATLSQAFRCMACAETEQSMRGVREMFGPVQRAACVAVPWLKQLCARAPVRSCAGRVAGLSRAGPPGEGLLCAVPPTSSRACHLLCRLNCQDLGPLHIAFPTLLSVFERGRGGGAERVGPHAASEGRRGRGGGG